jgi:hypothetical protein
MTGEPRIKAWEIDNNSGHYIPDRIFASTSLAHGVRAFERNGVQMAWDAERDYGGI